MKSITKKEIRSKLEEAVYKTLQSLELSVLSKKKRKAIKQSMRKITDGFDKELKKSNKDIKKKEKELRKVKPKKVVKTASKKIKKMANSVASKVAKKA